VWWLWRVLAAAMLACVCMRKNARWPGNAHRVCEGAVRPRRAQWVWAHFVRSRTLTRIRTHHSSPPLHTRTAMAIAWLCMLVCVTSTAAHSTCGGPFAEGVDYTGGDIAGPNASRSAQSPSLKQLNLSHTKLTHATTEHSRPARTAPQHPLACVLAIVRMLGHKDSLRRDACVKVNATFA
jgi:hypothetical protein